INAYKWDNENNAFQLHHKLKDEHFYLNSQLKMRNKLAEDVLDENMLILMKSFQKFLGTQGDELNDTIKLLEQTSTIISIFNDQRPINEIDDVRIKKLQIATEFFVDWEINIMTNDQLTNV
ncbi:MAG: hypothetical protein OEY28_05720, partial [Nitrospira sp.]|nr:hypothetical protein [Nitrospira sp.]